jgi:hypothetical protein
MEGKSSILQRSVFYLSRFFTVRAAPKTHEFHAFDATGEKRTARGLLDQLGHLPSYPSNTTSRPKFVMDTKKQNEYQGLYSEARRVIETWAKLGTGQKDNREDESRDRWKRVRFRIPKLRRSLQKSEGSSVREFGRHREHLHSLNRCSGHVGGAHVHLGETVAESHHVAKTNFNLYPHPESKKQCWGDVEAPGLHMAQLAGSRSA